MHTSLKKSIIKGKKYYIKIKASMQEDITFLNIYASSIGASKYIKQIQTAIKGEIDINTIIIGNLTSH